jgi:predicted amino acid dehydrogenase
MEQFAFIIHPMEVRRDVATKYPILRYFPESFVEWLMLHKSPVISSHITGIQSSTGPQAEGWFVGCPLSPRQLLGLPVDMVYDRIAAAGKLAAAQGAKVVGLGALTAVAGDAGISVAKRLEGIINVTTGNSYTVYTAVEGLLRAAHLMEIDIASANCAVVGATGSIGAVCAKMLARQVGQITLIGRNTVKLEALREEMAGANCPVKVTTDTSAGLQSADLVVAVSSAKDSIIFPKDLKSGAVVCDVARPRDVSVEVAQQRDDVLVIEGGVVEVPGDVDFHFKFGFPPKTAYACMSETMIMALEGTYEPYTLGRDLTVEQVERVGQLAMKHGFKLAGFRSFEKAISEEDIVRVRENAKRKKPEVGSQKSEVA